MMIVQQKQRYSVISAVVHCSTGIIVWTVEKKQKNNPIYTDSTKIKITDYNKVPNVITLTTITLYTQESMDSAAAACCCSSCCCLSFIFLEARFFSISTEAYVAFGSGSLLWCSSASWEVVERGPLTVEAAAVSDCCLPLFCSALWI